jgi:hypothetical protein
MQNANWEKIGIYLSIMAGFLTIIFYIADMKERIASLEAYKEINEEKMSELYQMRYEMMRK